MEEHWYVEWRGCLVLVVAHVAWIVASTAHARRDLWNALHSVSTPLDGLRFCVLLGILIPAVKTEKGRKPPANSSSLPLTRASDVTRLVTRTIDNVRVVS